MDDPIEIVQRAEAIATDLESKISAHLHQVFGHWNSLSSQIQQELWTLELARSIGKKSEELQRLKKEKELAEQEAAHFKIQVDDLSRLQHPREFKLQAPSTLPLDSKTVTEAAQLSGISSARGSIGLHLMDRNVHLDIVVERAISRWRDVVKEARGSSLGLTAQRSLSGESSLLSPHTNEPQSKPSQPHQSNSMGAEHQNQTQTKEQNHTANSVITDLTMGSDADEDADGEEDDFAMADVPHPSSQRNINGSLAQPGHYQYSNGNSNQVNGHAGDMDGLENASCIQGYVRVGVS